MGLLNQLFRHKGDLPGAGAMAEAAQTGLQAPPAGALAQRGLGAVAAAVGVRAEHGMPAEFELPLDDLLSRVSEKFIWPGRHDLGRVLRVPAGEVASGLSKGRAEISIARLVALAPDVFRWERTDSEDPRVRLNLQRLLQQIGRSDSTRPAPGVSAAPPTRAEPVAQPFPASAAAVANAALPSIAEERKPPAAEPSPSRELSPHPGAPVELRPQSIPAPPTTLQGAMPPTEPMTELFRTPPITGLPGDSPAVILRPAPAAPAASPPVRSAPVAPVEASRPPAPPPPPSAGANFSALQCLFMTDASLDLISVAAKAASLPGIHAIFISGTVGTAQVGHIPASLEVKMLRDLTDDFAGRLGDAGNGTGAVGAVSTTIQRDDCTIAIFVRDGVRLTAVLDARGFVAGVRERLGRATAYLAGAPSVE